MRLATRLLTRAARAGLVAGAAMSAAACGRLLPQPTLPTSTLAPASTITPMTCPQSPQSPQGFPGAEPMPAMPESPASPFDAGGDGAFEAPVAGEPDDGWSPHVDGDPAIASPPARRGPPPAPPPPPPPAFDDEEPGAGFLDDSDLEG